MYANPFRRRLSTTLRAIGIHPKHLLNRQSETRMKAIPQSMGKKIYVYTAITGRYDAPPSVSHIDERIAYLCFVTRPQRMPQPWQPVQIENYFADSKLTSGYLKTNSHLLFDKDSIVVWVDANLMELNIRSEEVLEIASKTGFATPRHRQRTTVASEAETVRAMQLDYPSRIEATIRELEKAEYPDDRGLSATMFVVRNHNDPQTSRANDAWWRSVLGLSRRDQLTFEFALWETSATHSEIDVDWTVPNRLFRRVPHKKPKGRQALTHSEDPARLSLPQGLPSNYPGVSATPETQWDWESLRLIHEINELVAESNERMEGNFCHFSNANVSYFVPPDPRRSQKREILRLASAEATFALEIGFNAGHSAAIILGSNESVALVSIDIGEHSYTLPCSELFRKSYIGRFDFILGDSADVLYSLDAGLVDRLDFVHIDGGHGEDTFCRDLEWFLSEAPTGCRLLVDDAYVTPISRALAAACEAGRLHPVDLGMAANGESALFEA